MSLDALEWVRGILLGLPHPQGNTLQSCTTSWWQSLSRIGEVGREIWE